MDSVLERAVSELVDRLINVVHAEHDTWAGKFVDLHSRWLAAVSRSKSHSEGTSLFCDEVSSTILITKRVSSNNNWLGPSWNTSGDVFNDDWLTEDNTADDVSDSAIGGLPHLFKIEFLNTCFVRSDSSALNTNFACFDRISAVNCDLVIGGVTVLDAQVEVLDVEVQVREDKLKNISD